jgi:hypothetical protein
MVATLQSVLWILLVMILMMWVLFWKGYSMWVAAREGHKRWFIALAVLNTFGILDLVYIFYIQKKTWRDIVNACKTKI